MRQVLAAHEHAGDVAHKHNLYENAAQHYQHALQVQVITTADRRRIEEKLIRALYLGRNPSAATPWLERLLTESINTPEGAADTVRLLLQLELLLLVAVRTAEAVPVVARAIQIAEAAGDLNLCKKANLRMAILCDNLGRSEDAEKFLNAVGRVLETDDVDLRVSFYMQRAAVAASQGKAAEAYDEFERAVQIAQKYGDERLFIAIWRDYARWAISLGNIEFGKICRERALLVIRQHHMGWAIPFYCLGYADTLAKMGQYTAAHEYVQEAFSYNVEAPTIDLMLAEVGIPLALHMKDEAMLAKCVRPHTLARAFKSGCLTDIGPVVAAYAQLYVVQDNQRKAHGLLHRALGAVNWADQTWNLPLVVARFGAMEDVPVARRLFEERAALPSSDVARACLSLFDAYVAQRHGQYEKVYMYAKQAVKLFEDLHWYGYADAAYSLLPAHSMKRTLVRRAALFADVLPTLTAREQQVVELVLKGRTNRAIALELAIQEHTVEKHTGSIMSKLGVRSRHQLADVLEGSLEP